MATLSTTQVGASAEYLRYSYGEVKKTDRVNEPCLLDFRLIPSDSSFVKLTRGAYITLTSSTYGVWYTGFITNDPELEFIGSQMVAGVRQPVLGYIYQATSDEYLLNLKPLGIIPPFVNTTQGAIIKYLINMLTPAGWTFDVTGVQAGQAVTRYVVDPAKKFTQVVKEFADPANFIFNIKNKIATFAQQDANPTGIAVDGSTRDFTPSRLVMKPVHDPIINDAIVIGDISPQAYFKEYFVGDGITAAFQLVNGVYGVDSTVLLDDSFSGTTIDTTKWTIIDSANTFLKPSNGYLNVIGGNNTNSFDTYLQSLTLIPLQGNLRLTHGEYDFVSASDGVIASLWSQNCSLGITNCIYGLRVQPSGSKTQLYPILNGVVDTSQGLTVDYTKRYNIRTLFTNFTLQPSSPPRSWRTKSGAISIFNPQATTATASLYTTVITAIDPTTGFITGQWRFTTSAPSNGPSYAYYCPVVSNAMHLTVTGITLSYPTQASLSVLPKNGVSTSNIHVAPTVIEATSITVAGVTAAASAVWTSDFMPVTPSSTLTVGLAEVSAGTNTGLAFYDFSFVALNLGVALPFTAGQVINVPSNAYYARWCGSDANLSAQTLIMTTVTSGYQTKLVGPNETESFDGMAPVAAIVDANSGVSSRSTVLGSPTYNTGQATLTFFKDSTKQITQTPQVGDMISLAYRVPGAAIGRVQDKTSLAAEASAFFDDGVRSMVVSGLTPLPKTDVDCETAAAAYVAMNSYQHYQGTYTMPSGSWFTAEPQSGTIMLFKNLPSSYPSVQSEAVTEVVTTFVHMQGTESFDHVLTYGPLNKMTQFLSTLANQTDVTVVQDTAEIPTFVDISALGVTTLPSVTSPTLLSWDSTNLHLDSGYTAPTGGGLEVRYSDDGWGCDDGRNLVSRFTGTTAFTVPRNTRGKICYIKGYDARNLCLWSEDLTNAVWTKSNINVANIWTKSPNNSYGLISSLEGGGSPAVVSQVINLSTLAAATTVTFSFSVQGVSGQQVKLTLSNGIGDTVNQTYAMRSGWQRFSLTHSFASMASTGALTVSFTQLDYRHLQITQCSLEVNSQETLYCRTKSTAYGAMSRYSSGVRVELPLPPPAPLATIALQLPAPSPTATPALPGSPSPVIVATTTGTSASNPSGVVAVTVPSVTLTLTLPTLAIDVWGFEVRAADNVTVLYHCDLSASSYQPYVQFPIGTSRSLTYNCYCYNLLGEYSPAQVVTWSIPTPVVSNLQVVANNSTLQWNCTSGSSAISFLVQAASDAAFTNILMSVTTTDYHVPLNSKLFFGNTYYRVTPTDAVGAGTAQTISNYYSPGTLSFGAANISVIQPPSDPRAPTFPVPTPFLPYGGTYSNLRYALWKVNTGSN